MIRGIVARKGELPEDGIILIEDEFWNYHLKMEDIRSSLSFPTDTVLLQRLDGIEIADWACIHVEG